MNDWNPDLTLSAIFHYQTRLLMIGFYFYRDILSESIRCAHDVLKEMHIVLE